MPIGHGEKEPFEALALWNCDGAADLAWIAFSPWGMGKRCNFLNLYFEWHAIFPIGNGENATAWVWGDAGA